MCFEILAIGEQTPLFLQLSSPHHGKTQLPNPEVLSDFVWLMGTNILGHIADFAFKVLQAASSRSGNPLANLCCIYCPDYAFSFP